MWLASGLWRAPVHTTRCPHPNPEPNRNRPDPNPDRDPGPNPNQLHLMRATLARRAGGEAAPPLSGEARAARSAAELTLTLTLT